MVDGTPVEFSIPKNIIVEIYKVVGNYRRQWTGPTKCDIPRPSSRRTESGDAHIYHYDLKPAIASSTSAIRLHPSYIFHLFSSSITNPTDTPFPYPMNPPNPKSIRYPAIPLWYVVSSCLIYFLYIVMYVAILSQLISPLLCSAVPPSRNHSSLRINAKVLITHTFSATASSKTPCSIMCTIESLSHHHLLLPSELNSIGGIYFIQSIMLAWHLILSSIVGNSIRLFGK